MSSTETQNDFETAHVLYMDIVGYSKLWTDHQPHVLQQLQDIIRSTEAFQETPRSELIKLPTGDGVALVYFGDPRAPVRCAIEVNKALQSPRGFQVRMGLHSGPVFRMRDINENLNVAGGGINLAQRVMDQGEGGHILLSKQMADDLRHLSEWSYALHDLGVIRVKHGVRVQVFNFYTSEFGNQNIPLKIATANGEADTVATDGKNSSMQPTKGRLLLLWDPRSSTDTEVLHVLQSEFLKAGYAVEFEGKAISDVEWARQIDNRFRNSDFVILLLSDTAASSEVFSYQAQIAHEVAVEQNGKPRLIYVRIDYDQPLPDSLAGILGSCASVSWSREHDDSLVIERVRELIEADEMEAEIGMVTLDPPGGSVPLHSKFYVARASDDAFLAAIERRDSIVLLKGARQMGKTSMLARGLKQARESGARVVLTDFQKLNAEHFASIDALFKALSTMLADQLELEKYPDETWDKRRGPNMNLERYMRREVLNKIPGALVWGLDEVDRLFSCEFGGEVFALFRAWHNERSLDPNSPWESLTLAVAYATEAHLFITDLNQSPFNVGTRVELHDFDFAQAGELNNRFGKQRPLTTGSKVERYYELVGGHPYLWQRGLHEMFTRALTLEELWEVSDLDDGPFGDHLRRILILLVREPGLSEAVRHLLHGKFSGSQEDFYRLRSSGVVSGESPDDARLRCRLYENYLRRQLLN